MFKARVLPPLVFLLACCPAFGQSVLFEVEATVTEDGQPYTFQVLGDKEDGSLKAYGIDVTGPDGTAQMLDEFESILPANSEADALIVEDVNFDGYADLRIMEYLPGGANVPYYYWLYSPSTGTFERSEAYAAVISPEVDEENRRLVSRQKVSDTEYLTEFFDPKGLVPVLTGKEVRVYSPDGSSKVHVFVVKDDAVPQLIETRSLPPEPKS